MKEYNIRLTTELIQTLLKGIKIQQVFGKEITITINPPQEGRFITMEELDNIIRDKTNATERLLKYMEKD